MSIIPARLGLQQRVLPEYRVPFFDVLATATLKGLSVFTGNPRPTEAIEIGKKLEIANHYQALNIHLLGGRYCLCWQLGLLIWLQTWNPDALIVEANPRYLATPLAIQWMHLRNRPVLGWGLGTRTSGSFESALRRRFLHSLDAVIAYSNAGAQQYVDSGIKPERVFVAANSVTKRPENPPLERPLEYINGTPQVLFIGRLQPRKRVDILLQACAALPPNLQPHLVVIGDGPDRARLESMAWDIYPKAVFTSAKHGEALEPYFATADLFVLPGTGGLAVQQAMAHTLPVIVGVADGTQSELVREENGWILSDHHVQTLTDTLRQALSDIPRLRQMGLVSYKIVSEEVNLEAMVETFSRAVRSVL